MGGLLSSPWRKTGTFAEEAKHLREELMTYSKTELKIMLVGHTGAGKSSLINSIFSISKGRIASMTSVKSDNLEGFGTHYFTDAKAGQEDLFQCISFFDTMGFTSVAKMDISTDHLKACIDGVLNVGHKFNEDEILLGGTKDTRPHCILLVVSALELDEYEPSHRHHDKLREVDTFISEKVAKIAVITKVDMVCPYSKKNFEFIYKSKKVKTLVKKAKEILGIQENHIFPIINFVDEIIVNEEESVPIMFLLRQAFGFAKDRKQTNTN